MIQGPCQGNCNEDHEHSNSTVRLYVPALIKTTCIIIIYKLLKLILLHPLAIVLCCECDYQNRLHILSSKQYSVKVTSKIVL